MYIASPFFTKEQLNVVEIAEKFCQVHNIDYYSPRNNSVSKMYSSLANDANSLTLHKDVIFHDNVSNIDKHKEVIAYLHGFDSGTLFEVGYALARNYPVLLIDPGDRMHLEDYKDLVHELSLYNDLNHTVIQFRDGSYSIDQVSEVLSRCNVVAETDEYRGYSKIVLGYLYSTNQLFNYYDLASRKSNIMITSAGRVLVTDDPKYLNSDIGTLIQNSELLVGSKDD